MLEGLQQLYSAENSYGESFLSPLKAYNGYFRHKAAASQNISQCVGWRITQVFIGIIAYPLLGGIAIIGMTIKLCELSAVWLHNRKQKDSFLYICTSGINMETSFGPSKDMQVVNSFKLPVIDWEKEKHKVFDAIDKQTASLHRIYIHHAFSKLNAASIVTIDLKISPANFL